MPEKNEVTIAGQSFEGLQQVNEHGAEFWSARALKPLKKDPHSKSSKLTEYLPIGARIFT